MIVESYEDTIVLSGTMRSNHWETLHTAISLTLKRHPSGVIIDCAALSECTPHGADTFRSVMGFIKEHDARVIVAEVQEPVMAVLRTVPDVRSQLPIVATVEEARRSLDLLTDPSEEPVKKRKLKFSDFSVLASVTGGESDAQVLWTAKEIVNNLQGAVHVVFPLIIPREMPLQAAMPEEEELARQALNRAEAFFQSNHIHCEIRVMRGRDIASSLFATLEEDTSSHVIVGLPQDGDGQDEAGKLVKSVLGRLSGSVVFVRGPIV